MINFTPLESTLGGSIIGIAAAVLLLGSGEILGCSGIVSSLFLKPNETLSPTNRWKFVHIGTFLLTSYLYHFCILGEDSSAYVVPTVGTVRVPNSLAHIVGGFLVGIGSRLGAGCTSGHGICGLARFSKRSFVAVMTFMFTAIASASFFDKVEIFSAPDDDLSWIPNGISTPFALSIVILFAIGAAFVLAKSHFSNRSIDNVKNIDMNIKDNQDDTSESEARVSDLVSTKENDYVDIAVNGIEDRSPTTKEEDDQSQNPFIGMAKSYFFSTPNDGVKEAKADSFEESPVSDPESGAKDSDLNPKRVEDFQDDITIDVIEDQTSTEHENEMQLRRNISLRKNIFGALSGILFALGLAISGMIKQYKVISFLDIVSFQNWDPSLVFVMGGGVVISFASYQYVKDHGVIKNEKAVSCPPLLSKQCSFNVPTSTTIDAQLVIGASLFGIGWGIAGFCPGPALYAFAAGMPKAMWYWWPSNVLGNVLGELLSRYLPKNYIHPHKLIISPKNFLVTYFITINFQPLESILGGGLLGVASAILLLGSGDILGCSGIVSSLILKPKETLSPTNRWKFVHLGAFLLTSTLYHFYVLKQDISAYVVPTPGTIRVPNTWAYVVGGFLVGFGTKLGAGCTSGHGICGLARFSKRSFAAVMTFMATGVATSSTFDVVEIFSAPDDDLSWAPNDISIPCSLAIVALFAVCGAMAFGHSLFVKTFHTIGEETSNDPEAVAETANVDDIEKFDESKESQETSIEDARNIGLRKNIFGALSGAIFAAGLGLAGMIKQYKVISFLNIVDFKNWDPSLMFVMGGGLIISFLSYQYVEGHGVIFKTKAMATPPLLNKKCSFNVPLKSAIDAQLIVGSALFGVGWAIGGFCPGPALYAFAAGMPKAMIYWWPCNIVGTILAEIVSK